MANDLVFQVFRAAVGVDESAVRVPGHGVDGEVAPLQVRFQGDPRRGVDGKAPVAWAGFALGAGQGVFFFGVRMQEDGKILAHLQVA